MENPDEVVSDMYRLGLNLGTFLKRTVIKMVHELNDLLERTNEVDRNIGYDNIQKIKDAISSSSSSMEKVGKLSLIMSQIKRKFSNTTDMQFESHVGVENLIKYGLAVKKYKELL